MNRITNKNISIIKVLNKTNELFNRAMNACMMALGCIPTTLQDTTYIVCFEEYDDLVIIDELERAGSKLLGYSTMEEYMQLFA